MHVNNQEIKECVDLRACAYTNWYKKFRKLTFDSVCIPLPQEIVKYLLDEIIILPKECYSNDEEGAFEDDNGAAGGNDDDDDEDDVVQPEFPEFSQTLASAVSRLGGAVFVKTNWNSPKDAFWITAGQTMCCKDITDIYQLLKASGICKEDLGCHNLPIFDLEPLADACSSTDTDSSDSSASKENNQFLIFKKWHDIHPGTEFRCFVRNKKLIAISPRDWPQYHEYISTQRVNIVNDIVSIFKEHIKPKFPLYDYVFDVVRDTKDRVSLLDFSPFSEKHSESLAFEWNELLDDCETIDEDDEEEEDPEFRYLNSDCGIQPSKRNNYGIPKDVIDMFRASSSSSSNEQTSTEPPNTLDDVINNRLENIFLNQPDDDRQTT